MTQSSAAWLLQVDDDLCVAFQQYQVKAYLAQTNPIAVPLAPAFCRHMIFWQQRIVPVLDLAVYSHPTRWQQAPIAGSAEPAQSNEPASSCAIIAYRKQANSNIDYIALVLRQAPEKIQVSDKMACDWPEQFCEAIKPFVTCLFNTQKNIAAVIDIAKLLYQH